MRNLGEYCPVSKAAELFGERWTALLVREMGLGATRFSEFQRGLPGIPRSILSKRLKTLEDAGLLERRVCESPRSVTYNLTRQGWEMCDVVAALADWSEKWLDRDFTDEDVDPTALVWDMYRNVSFDRLPEQRVVVQIDFCGDSQKSFWLVLETPNPSVCDYDPGFGVDLVLRADAAELTRVWKGARSWKAAINCGKVELRGITRYARQFPSWFEKQECGAALASA